MASYTATGIALMVHRYRGTERVVVFYTRERGKVEARASGVGRPGSKLAAAIEPLTLSRLQLAEGRELDRLTQCEVLESHFSLRNDLERLALASYAAELVARTTEPGEADPETFDALAQTLAALQATGQPELVTWAFVLRYLCLHGLAPALNCCTTCGCDLTGTTEYSPGQGGCLCQACRQLGEGGLEVTAQVRAVLAALLRLPADRVERLRTAPGVQGQVRELLRRHVRYHLGVSLRSEEFMRKMARVTTQRPPAGAPATTDDKRQAPEGLPPEDAAG
jgi:DNA repair protein RecO (recombination protein O)